MSNMQMVRNVLWGVLALVSLAALLLVTHLYLQQRHNAAALMDFHVMQQRLIAEIQQPEADTRVAMGDCQGERLAGKLKNYTEMARCVNTRMMDAYARVHYKDMDIIELYADKRLELAQQIDSGKLTPQAADIQMVNVMNQVHIVELQRLWVRK